MRQDEPILTVVTAAGRFHTAIAIANKFNIPSEMLLQLSADGIMPHYRMKGFAEPLFNLESAQTWIADNLIQRIEGNKLPLPKLTVIQELVVPGSQVLPVPREISQLPGLRQIDARLFCGIYFLCKQGKVVYIGQSVNIHSRVGQHCEDKEFDAVFLFQCPQAHLNELERTFIRELQPPLNRTGRLPTSRDVRNLKQRAKGEREVLVQKIVQGEART